MLAPMRLAVLHLKVQIINSAFALTKENDTEYCMLWQETKVRLWHRHFALRKASNTAKFVQNTRIALTAYEVVL